MLPDSQWYGVLGSREVHTQRSGCQKLHVSRHVYIELEALMHDSAVGVVINLLITIILLGLTLTS